MIEWSRYGFLGDHESEELKRYEKFDEFPFILYEKDGFLTVYSDGLEYKYSEGRIPATNQSVVLLLKSFAVKREKQ